MKQFFLVILSIFILASCQQAAFEYSCDPALNDYVSVNKEELSQITITEFASSDLVFQQAVFRSFDAGKKRDIWLKKIQALLETEKYSEAEYQHVKKLRDFISVDFFEVENIESKVEEREAFASNWILYAKKSLGWSEKDVAFVIYRLYTTHIQFDSELAVLAKMETQVSINSESGTCNCNTTSSFCTVSCNSGDCKISSGCGFLWSQTCNGVCH